MPTKADTDTAPQGYLLSTVRQGQAAVIDTVRIWTGVTEQACLYTFVARA